MKKTTKAKTKSKAKKILKTPQSFYNFFAAIPKKEWCVGEYTQLEGTVVQHCALGHLGFGPGKTSKNGKRLTHLFAQKMQAGVVDINDGDGELRFRQKHPKSRILAALIDCGAKKK